MGSTMLQMSESVGSFMKGSITPVSASGTTSMSLAWMGIQPRIEEPSKPSPSSNTPSVSSAMGMVKCCHRPRKSMNLRSTITAFLSCARPRTSFAFFMRTSLGWILLQRRLAALAGADADHLVDRRDEDLPVPDAARLGRALDRLQRLGDHLVGEHDLDLHLGQEVDHVFGAPVELGVAFLPPEPLHLGHRQPEDADVGQRLLHLVELEGLDDGFDLLRRRAPVRRAQSTCHTRGLQPPSCCYTGARGLCRRTPRPDRAPARPRAAAGRRASPRRAGAALPRR